jgi:hypothetical protein
MSTDYITDRALEEIFPTPAQSAVLWQMYLENVHPLCKIIHPPSFQKTVESSRSSVRCVSKSTLALLFSIYTFAITSMTTVECERKLGHPRSSLLKQFLYGTRQALVKAAFLRSSDIITLQAFIHFLVCSSHAMAISFTDYRLSYPCGVHLMRRLCGDYPVWHFGYMFSILQYGFIKLY